MNKTSYYYDCEFLEGKQDKTIFGFKYGETSPTIDLISIGIVSGDDREYYAISKDFNLYEAWNRYDLQKANTNKNHSLNHRKVYWIRENVLKPIWIDLFKIHNKFPDKENAIKAWEKLTDREKYIYFKLLLDKYGKTNKQIAEEIKSFVTPEWYWSDGLGELPNNRLADNPIQLYGYYSDYDHVALSWLFGKMIDLPSGFPMYTKDLKQELDGMNWTFRSDYKQPEHHFNYPTPSDNHHSLEDAKFNKRLHKFILEESIKTKQRNNNLNRQ